MLAVNMGAKLVHFMHRQCLENILSVHRGIENSVLKTQIHTVDYKNHTVDFVNHTADYKNYSVDLSFQRTIFYSSMYRFFYFAGKLKTKAILFLISLFVHTFHCTSAWVVHVLETCVPRKGFCC